MMFTPADPAALEIAIEWGFLTQPQYHLWGLTSAEPRVRLLPALLTQLRVAERALPDNYRLLLWDGYRPTTVQQQLFDSLHSYLQRKQPQWAAAQVSAAMSELVSMPDKHAPHLSGLAVDLTLCDTRGRAYPLGTDFDDFGDKAATDYFQQAGNINCMADALAADHRELLIKAMQAAGLRNNPAEWWHFELPD